MFSVRTLITLSLILGLSGCFVGSSEEFISRSDAKAVLPRTVEGVLSLEDEQDQDVRILRERGSNDYEMRFLSEPDRKPTKLRFFEVGSVTIYGVQATVPTAGGKAVYYSLIGLRQTETVQIELYAFNISEEWLNRKNISYSGTMGTGLNLRSKRDLDKFMTGIVADKAYQKTSTIRTWTGGFAARSQGDTRGAGSASDFITDGYAAGDLLAAIHDGQFKDVNAYLFSPYLLEFGTYMNQIDGDSPCLTLFTQRVRTQLPVMAAGRSLEIVLGNLYNTHSNRPSGRERAFVEGLVGGGETFGAIAAMTLGGKADASLFYRRHGCASRTSREFFKQFNEFVASGSE